MSKHPREIVESANTITEDGIRQAVKLLRKVDEEHRQQQLSEWRLMK